MEINGKFVSFVFMDTSPCIAEYRSEDEGGWDPCGSDYPTCSLKGDNHDQFEGPCKFHENILTQDCGKQKKWLQITFDALDPDDWVILVGHHPLDEVDVEDFASIVKGK